MSKEVEQIHKFIWTKLVNNLIEIRISMEMELIDMVVKVTSVEEKKFWTTVVEYIKVTQCYQRNLNSKSIDYQLSMKTNILIWT